jgi:ribose transport system ATP-binding protein
MPVRTLAAVSLRKDYPGTVALDGVSLDFDGGRIHALIGKNGAGKSTFVKILAGAVRPTSGTILVDGAPIELRSPREALARGIAAVHQELSLVPGLTVAENVLLGRLPRSHGPLIDWPAAFKRAQEVLDDLGVAVDVREQAGRLGVARQQLVEIAKAMSYNPAVLLLDEPTSALARQEAEHLFSLLRRLASRGVVILYVSHRLDEILRIADTVNVLRDGRHVGSLERSEVTTARMVHLMFGAEVLQTRPTDLRPAAHPAMTVSGLSRAGAFEDISFTLREGEILGIAGVLGSGRTEILRALFGAEPPERGTVEIGGQRVRPASPAQMKELGVVLAPEDRKVEGLVQGLSTRVNMAMAGLRRIARRGFITRARETAVALERVRELQIHVPDLEAPVSSLSGGNQQKVVLGKWLTIRPKVLLLDEPTRGIDVHAKQQIFGILFDLSRRGIGAVVVSSELEELLMVCHRILILTNGRVTGELDAGSASLEQVFAACMPSA